MGNIVLLDDLTINKIAAGEVIERPASVVKEMVENSIDAGATSVNIEVQNGGISKIRISDNGKGMEPDDMVIAFERHATSKIRQANDLDYVRTMGFRGEALASIAAISRVEMVSRTKDSDTGYKVVIEAGNVISEEMTACSVGTTITVEKLFFNTPVRYKFLKKDYTEAGYIEDAVKRIALVNPNLSIKLINNGKTVLQTSGNGKLEDVIYSIYGKDIVAGLLPINYKYENILVSGVIGKPEIARSNRSNQMFFVNNRFVKDKTLSAAVEQAMKGMLPIGKYPFLVMNIEMDPVKVDVNVHPAKLEVRFADESEVFKAVMHAIKESLLAGSLINNVGTEKDVDEIYNEHHNREIELEKLKEEAKNYEYKPRVMPEPKSSDNESTPDRTSTNFNSFAETNVSSVEKPEHKISARNIVELFRKVSKEKETEELQNENLFNDIYMSKAGKEVEKKSNENYNQENKELKSSDNVVEEEPSDYSKTNPYKFDGLEKLQADVMKDIEKMPVLTEKTVFDNDSDVKEENKNNVTLVKTPQTQEPKEDDAPQDFDTMYEKTFGEMPASAKPKENKFDNLQYVESDNISMFTKNDKYKGYKYIGTAFSTYIILEIADELYMLDQHAAHERIMYERIKANYYSQNKDCQMMLLPDVITLTNKEVWILKENIGIFEKAGFKVEEFGEKTVKLIGVPSLCMDMDTKSLFLDILDELDTVARTERQELEERFIATVACKSAVKANMHLELPEIITLLDTLMELPNPFTCPHGRPTAIKMTKNDIERKFSRR